MWCALVAALLCGASHAAAPAAGQPHYVDGAHQPAFDAHARTRLAAHTCAELQTQHLPLRSTLAFGDSALGERLRARLAAQQRPRGACAAQRVLLVDLHSDCGLGAELHWLTVVLGAAFDTRRTLVVREDRAWLYAAAPLCAAGHSLSCYLQPLSTCTVRSAADLAALLGDEYASEAAVPVLTTQTRHALAHERVVRFTRDLQQQLDFEFFRFVPDEFKRAHAKSALFWWRSQLARFIVAPNAMLQAHVDQRRVDIGINRYDLLGVHVRRGDKVFGSRINRPEMDELEFGVMFNHTAAIAQQCGFDGVYVASKSAELLEFVDRESSATPDLVWLADRSQRRSARGWDTTELIDGALNRTQEALDVFADILLLAEMRGFIGTFESNLSRLVAELAASTVELDLMSFNQKSWIVFP